MTEIDPRRLAAALLFAAAREVGTSHHAAVHLKDLAKAIETEADFVFRSLAWTFHECRALSNALATVVDHAWDLIRESPEGRNEALTEGCHHLFLAWMEGARLPAETHRALGALFFEVSRLHWRYEVEDDGGLTRIAAVAHAHAQHLPPDVRDLLNSAHIELHGEPMPRADYAQAHLHYSLVSAALALYDAEGAGSLHAILMDAQADAKVWLDGGPRPSSSLLATAALGLAASHPEVAAVVSEALQVLRRTLRARPKGESGEIARCLCDGGAYETPRYPFLMHEKCEVHGVGGSGA